MFSTSYDLWQIKRFSKKAQSDNVLKDKAFKIASNPKYDGNQRGLASMIYKFFDKKSKGNGISASLVNKSANEPNYQLENELHYPIIGKI